MKRAALALAALSAATLAMAQQTTPPTASEPRMSSTPQERPAPRANWGAHISEADKQTLMMNCTKQVQAENPNVAEKDIKGYCDNAVKSHSSPH